MTCTFKVGTLAAGANKTRPSPSIIDIADPLRGDRGLSLLAEVIDRHTPDSLSFRWFAYPYRLVAIRLTLGIVVKHIPLPSARLSGYLPVN